MLQPVVRRTWAPRGQTPVHHSWDRHDQLSAIPALTVSPKRRRLGLHFDIHDHHIRTDEVEAFVRGLCRHSPEGLILVMDRLAAHRSAAKRHPGPVPRLSNRQRKQLERILLKGARRQGYRTELWTLPRIAEVIERRFGVTYDASSVWHILRKMDWSCQKPERRARERDEERIARWRKQDWPRIKKSAKKRP